MIALHNNNLQQAQSIAQQVETGPKGNTRDLATIVTAATLARTKQPEAALTLIGPLIGKILDPFAQDLLHETAVSAAIQAQRWYQAVIYMNEWIHTANPADKQSVTTRIEQALQQFPQHALESALLSMGTEQANEIWERKLREAIARRAMNIAMERSDQALARSVLDSSRGVITDERLSSLAQLALLGGRTPRIIGARVGWLTSSSDSITTSRSAQSIAGALEIFTPNRSTNPTASTTSQNLPLIIARDSTKENQTAPLDDLAYHGVSIIVGGHDTKSATELSNYAESHSIPVILLVAPEQPPNPHKFSFIIGEPDTDCANPTPSPPDSQAASQVDPTSSIRICQTPTDNAPNTAHCDKNKHRPGHPTFPLAQWKSSAIFAIAIDAPQWCADQFLSESHAANFTPSIFLGLEARDARPNRTDHINIPTCGLLESNHPTIQKWRNTFGTNPSWFQALGRDAALLAHNAIAEQLNNTATTTEEVARTRSQAKSRLSQTQAVLWTTDAQGFQGNQQINRQIRWIPRPPHTQKPH